MTHVREELVFQLRDMARRGGPVSQMFRKLRDYLGPDIVSIMEHMRSAFQLGLVEVKPLAALSRTDTRDLVNEELLEELMMPPIMHHRSQWNSQQGAVAGH